MKINPESWLLNKNKTVLLNIDNGKAIKNIRGYFEVCNTVSDPEGYCKIVSEKAIVPMGSEDKYFVDDILYAKLSRIFEDGFDYSDYNLY